MGRSRKPRGKVSQSRREVALKRHRGAKRKLPPPAETTTAPPGPIALPIDHPATLADYDRLIGQPQFWTDAKTREQVQKEILDNEAKQDENAIRRGKLYTKDQVLDQLREFREMVFQHFAKLPEVMSELVDPEKKEDARRRAREFVTEMRKAIAKEIGERKWK